MHSVIKLGTGFPKLRLPDSHTSDSFCLIAGRLPSDSKAQTNQVAKGKAESKRTKGETQAKVRNKRK